jgi:hypothetical protein
MGGPGPDRRKDQKKPLAAGNRYGRPLCVEVHDSVGGASKAPPYCLTLRASG